MSGKLNLAPLIAVMILVGLLYNIPSRSVSESDLQAQNVSNQSMETAAAETGLAATGDDFGHVKIVTTCKLSNESCASISDNIFRITPYVFSGNNLLQLGEFPPSDRGRTVQFDAFGGPVTYQIKQDMTPLAQELFYAYPYFSYDCEGEIKSGQTKTCTIETNLYLRN